MRLTPAKTFSPPGKRSKLHSTQDGASFGEAAFADKTLTFTALLALAPATTQALTLSLTLALALAQSLGLALALSLGLTLAITIA